MTAIKYVSITKTSRATATRDLQDLTQKNILIPSGEGRNRSYNLIWFLDKLIFKLTKNPFKIVLLHLWKIPSTTNIL